MMDSAIGSTHPTGRHPFEELADEFVSQLRVGQSPSIEQYAQSHPEFAEMIRSVFPSLELVERVSAKDATVPLASTLPIEKGFRIDVDHRYFDDFEIIGRIGQGGMGVVYEAVQGSLQRTVALKVIHPQAAASQQSRSRFRREAESAAGLHHTNIVPVYGSGEDHGLLYYAMQLIDGSTLARIIQQVTQHRRTGNDPTESSDRSDCHVDLEIYRHVMPVPRSVSIAQLPKPYYRNVSRLMSQVAGALDYAHQSGVLHRDIKPSNLLLDHSGTIWVADFGLARREDLDGQTQTGELLGTIRYMAPEQFTGKSDSRSDIYSLGLTLFELLTLRPALDAPKRRLLDPAKYSHVEFSLSEKRTVPVQLQTIVLKATAIDPANRYQRAHEFQEDLERYLDDRPILARRESLIESSIRWARRNPAIATLTATLFGLLLAIATILGLWNQQQLRAVASLKKAYNESANNLIERTKALERAETQSRRAKQNMDLALEAFNTITENIASRGSGLDVLDDESQEVDSTGFSDAVLTQADVELLNSLQSFFDRFAEENQADLRLDAAISRRRVGEIEHKIGKHEQAAGTLNKAIADFEAIRSTQGIGDDIQKVLSEEFEARVELIGLYARRDQFPRAQEEMDKLRSVLKSNSEFEQSDQGRYLLASALSSLCSGEARLALQRSLNDRRRRAIPPFPNRPNGFGIEVAPPIALRLERDLNFNTEAISLLQGLCDQRPLNPQYRLELARNHRDRMRMSRLLGNQTAFDESLGQAKQILEEMLGKNPNSAVLKYELANLYASSLVHPGSDGDRLEEAQRLIKEVLEEHASVPEYQSLYAALLIRSAWAQPFSLDPPLERQFERVENGMMKLQQAIAIQQGLVERFPEIPLYGINLLQSKVQLVDFASQFRRPEKAKQSLAEAIMLAEKMLESGTGRQPVVRTILERLRERKNAIENRPEQEKS